jgi:hypothetical protein
MKYLLFAVALFLTACGGGGGSSTRPRPLPTPQNLLTSSVWQLGPIIDGKNYSEGVPAPVATTEGLAFTVPQLPYSIHYVTMAYGSLAGTTLIRMQGRIEADPDVQLLGANCPPGPTALTLYFQEKNDDWNTDGKRWWATFATTEAGLAESFEIVAPLDGPWTSVEKKTAANDPGDFTEAKQNAARVGFTFRNCTGYGHGAYATGPARIIVTSFAVE